MTSLFFELSVCKVRLPDEYIWILFTNIILYGLHGNDDELSLEYPWALKQLTINNKLIFYYIMLICGIIKRSIGNAITAIQYLHYTEAKI